MANWQYLIAFLIPSLPLLACLWIGLGVIFKWNHGEKGERETARVAVGSAALVFILLLVLDIYSLVGWA